MNCELERITVSYQMYGEGRPLLMLHGWSLDHRHLVSNLEQNKHNRKIKVEKMTEK